MTTNIKLGVSLYCFTNEYYERTFSFEDCLAKTKQVGATGIEIVAAQMLKGYPWPSPRTIAHYRALFERYGLEPVCYGASVDRGLRSDREQTTEELFRGIEWDIRSAADLGCSVLRTQILLTPEVLEKVAPIAEKYCVKVGVEIHNPSTAHSPEVVAYTRMFERVRSPWIGFIPDFGQFQERPDKFARESFLEKGARPEVFDLITDCVERAVPKEKALTELKKTNPKGVEFGALEFCYVRYKPSDFEAFKEMLPFTVYCHGKFYYVDENYNDPAIPYPTVLKMLKESGFNGYIISEYEGHMFGDRGDVVEYVRRHLEMERRLLA